MNQLIYSVFCMVKYLIVFLLDYEWFIDELKNKQVSKGHQYF